jgi:AraC family transcriptional regulator
LIIRNRGQAGTAAVSYVLRMKAETQTFYQAAVRCAVERVAISLDEALDLEALARGAALSTFHFHRVFRGLVGETPLELHRRLRLERAAERLCTTADAVTGIAFDAGYESHEAFIRAFRQSYGTSPSKLRERAKDQASACHGGPTTRIPSLCALHVRDGAVDLGALALPSFQEAPMDVVIENLPARRLAMIRHRGPYAEIGEAFHRLGQIAARIDLYAHAEPAMLASDDDDPESTPPSELRSDAALIVQPTAKLPPALVEGTLAGGRYARTTHLGSYAGLGDAWARFLGRWLPPSGHRIGAGPSYEVYVTDPRTTPVEQLRTDLYVPLD